MQCSQKKRRRKSGGGGADKRKKEKKKQKTNNIVYCVVNDNYKSRFQKVQYVYPYKSTEELELIKS